VYLSREVEYPEAHPSAKIPVVTFPTADPPYDAELAAVATVFTSPE
jgi:hypothetical protein